LGGGGVGGFGGWGGGGGAGGSPRGGVISYNSHKDILKEGYDISRLINYSVDHNDEIKAEIIEELKKNIPDIVYIYSENSAKSFLNIVKNYDLIDSWMNTNLMCIGEKTSSVLNELKWKKIFLFIPGEEEFLLYRV
jgi:Uroporphyrinogen-III synthase HemD.